MKRNEGKQSRARFCFSLEESQNGSLSRQEAVFTMGVDSFDDGTARSRSGEGWIQIERVGQIAVEQAGP